MLVDCDTSNRGCLSGNPGNSMVYAYKTGVADGTKYTYTSGATGKNGTCQKSYPSIWKLSNFCLVNLGGNEMYLKSIIYTYGPMAVTIDGSDPGLSNYKSGVFTSTTCSNSTKLSNLVVVRKLEAQNCAEN